MGKTKYEVSRVEIDVKCAGKVGEEAKEEKMKIFFDFCKVFQQHLSKYANRYGVPTTGTAYGNNINLKTPISINTLNHIIKSVEENSDFSVKKIEYYLNSKMVVVTIMKLD